MYWKDCERHSRVVNYAWIFTVTKSCSDKTSLFVMILLPADVSDPTPTPSDTFGRDFAIGFVLAHIPFCGTIGLIVGVTYWCCRRKRRRRKREKARIEPSALEMETVKDIQVCVVYKHKCMHIHTHTHMYI